jgi:hypothetical protein
MVDPRQASAEEAGRRRPRWLRLLGWALGVLLWAVASDARPLVALLSLLAALVLRGGYVIVGWGKGRSIFWSPWFFAVAAVCEVAWLIADGRLF